MLKTFIITALFIALAFEQTTAQQKKIDPFTFIPTKNDSSMFIEDLRTIEKNYQTSIETISGKLKKEYIKIYAERFENIKSYFTEKKLLTNKAAHQYLQQITAEIKSSNPKLQDLPIKIFFAKSDVPNAAYLGENMIVFNLGLFYRLNNESEVAFVICHELAHLYNKHSDNQINKYVQTVFSDEFQKELRSINKLQYKTREKVEKLALNIGLSNSKHSRFKETEADSLGLEFFSNTKFDQGAALNVLEILDKLDDEKFNTEAALRQYFGNSEFPFKEKWLEKEEGLFGGHATDVYEEMNDSLKTHPDCKKRIIEIKKLQQNKSQFGNNNHKNLNSAQEFESFSKSFKLEVIESAYQNNNHAAALFYAFKVLDSTQIQPFIVVKIGKIFKDFYTYQQRHELGNIALMPSPQYPKDFNLLLQFIQNIELEDYKKIGYYFLKSFQHQLATNSSYQNQLQLTK